MSRPQIAAPMPVHPLDIEAAEPRTPMIIAEMIVDNFATSCPAFKQVSWAAQLRLVQAIRDALVVAAGGGK